MNCFVSQMLLVVAAVGVTSCGSTPQPQPLLRPVEKKQDSPPRPVVKENDFPIAVRIQDEPNYVISPYSGKKVDIEGIPAGKTVYDPTSGENRTDMKKFVVPE